MKRFLLGLCSLALLAVGCNNLDEIEGRLGNLEDRVTYLEDLCKEMNANVTTLQAFVSAHKNDLFVTSVAEVSDGFVITFSDGQRYSLKNGEKGNKGEKGDPGETGPQGSAPSIGLKQLENGDVVWTVNGETVLVGGEPVSALGITPKLEIRDNKWVISYDGGTTWTEIAPAYDTSNRLVITEDDDFVYFTFGTDPPFALAKGGGFSFVMEKVSDVMISAGETLKIGYTLKQADESVRFDVRATGGFTGSVDTENKQVSITAPDPMADGYVVVTAVKNSTGEVQAQYVTFTSGILTLVSTAHTAPAEGGTVEVVFDTNLDYTVSIPDGCDWISKAPGTKATTRETVQLLVEANTKAARSAEVSIVPASGNPLKVLISQDGDPNYNPNTFTYVLWGVEGQFVGNNMGLTPLVKYGNQIRMKPEDSEITLVPLQSDIPAGATVSYNNGSVSGSSNWKLTNNSNNNDGISGFVKPGAEGVNGSFKLKYTTTPNSPRVHVAAVTVTVSGLGGDADVPYTRVIPIFIDQSGYKTIGDDKFLISYTPFAIRVNPKTGGEGAGPVITAETTGDPAQIRLDYRRNFFFFKFNGESAHNLKDALNATNASSHYLNGVWTSYFTENGAAVNYGSCTPVSYFNDKNSEVEGKLATTGAYIDNANGLKVVVNPQKFKDTADIYSEGVFIGTVNANSAGLNPIANQQAETWPFVIWIDPTYNE
ncbi:MAG: DUF4958 family protein [Bacteroidales bacterium]|nr:DUF4958 family protein [Bacteroidales bacterium]